MKLKLSLIIPVFNEQENIRNLLKSIIENSSDDYDIEIIVIDDGSTDNTKKIVLEFGNLIKYIFINKSGVAKARNIGIKNATGSLLFFFDGDVTLKSDTLKKFVKYFESNADLNILQGLWEKYYPTKTNFITKHLLLKLNHNFEELYKKETKHFNFNGIKVSELLTGCLCIRKKVIENIKFDENYKHAGGEEFELGLRIVKFFDIYYTPNIKIFHKFENIFVTYKRILFRTINYSLIIFNYRKKFKSSKNIANQTSVPNRDIRNMFIGSLILPLIPLCFWFSNWIYLICIFFLLYYFNNFKLLTYINKNMGFIDMIKSFFVELGVTYVKLCGIAFGLIIFYFLNKDEYKI